MAVKASVYSIFKMLKQLNPCRRNIQKNSKKQGAQNLLEIKTIRNNAQKIGSGSAIVDESYC